MRRILETCVDVTSEAWQELKRARLRTYLAFAGIVLGAIGLTVWMCMFHLESMQQSREENNNIEINMPGEFDGYPLVFTHMRRLRRYHFTPADGEAIRRECPYVERVKISGGVWGVDFKGSRWYHGQLLSTNSRQVGIVQVRPNEFATEPELGTLQWGRTFTLAEMASGARVILIDERMAVRLWREADRAASPNRLGSPYIRINGVRFEVIGLLVGQLGGPRAIVPCTCMEQMFWDARWYLSADAQPGFRRAAAREINRILSRRVGDPGPGYTYVALPGMGSEILRVFAFFGIVGVLVLLSAGVALSNKAYIDALERVQQFAVRRALGATTQRIYAIVLTESALVCGFGCLYGGLIGWMFFAAFAAWQLPGIASDESKVWSAIPAWPLGCVYLSVIALGIVGSLQGAAVAAKANPAEVLARKDVV